MKPIRSGGLLTEDQWRTLLHKLTVHAASHINRWYWRGSAGGILPDGFDPESLAAQAIADFLQAHESGCPLGCTTTQSPTGTPGARARESAGSFPSPFPRGEGKGEGPISINHFLSLPQLQRHLERRVRRIVNRLHHRAENRLLRNEPDLAPVLLDDGELTSRINLVPDPTSSPAEVLLEKESVREFARNVLRFPASLGPDPNLHRLLHCYCSGHSKPRHLATALKLRPATIKNLRRRFLRKWKRFHQCP